MTAPAAPDPPVRLTAVVKHYGRRTVLDGVGFDVLPGVTGLIGPNGAGKSTLVRAILGLVRLAGGTVRVFGRDPAAAPRAVRRLVGVVPEDDCAIPGLSGVEMVRYAGRLSGLPATEALRRAHEVLDWCDAGEERYRPVETLAVGVRQKVAFAAALVHDPALLILDEPTNGLDPLERRAMLGRLVTLAREHGKTVLVSTHVLRDVQAVCDHAVLLVRGRVRLRGAVADLTAAAAGGELRLEGTGPLGALAAALAARGIPARPAAADDPALLVGTAADAAPAVWRCARETGVTVTALGPARRDLEEVFLAALGGDGADAENTHAAP